MKVGGSGTINGNLNVGGGSLSISNALTVVPGADHSFRVPKRGSISDEDAMAIIVEAVLEFVVRDVVGNRTTT